MTDNAVSESDEVEIAFNLQYSEPGAAELLHEAFQDADVFESASFTGLNTLVVILSGGLKAVQRLIGFFARHRESYRGATLKIGVDEIDISGYTSEELQALLDSGSLQKLVRELKK